MSGEYRSVTEGAILIGTIIAWNVLIDWLNYRVPALQSWLEPPPLLLVDNGRLNHRNLRHEFVTEEELKSKLREKGVDDVRQVAKAYMDARKGVRTLFAEKGPDPFSYFSRRSVISRRACKARARRVIATRRGQLLQQIAVRP